MAEQATGAATTNRPPFFSEGWNRNILALSITAVSVIGVIVLSVKILNETKDDEIQQSAQLIFTGVLPLLGAWVGTVLAYYFSKENFEAATRSVTEISRSKTGEAALAAIIVKDVMIKRSDMLAFKTPFNKLVLAKLLEELEKAKKGSRVPVLDGDDKPQLIIHRSIIDMFLSKEARDGMESDELAKLTMQQLFDKAPDRRAKLERSFATVKPDDTLAIAKAALDRDPDIQDVFVTANGKRDGAVLGWVTNAIIAENAKV